jgi:hypothetical protein
MNYEGISFNSEWVASQKQGDFVKHESHHGLSVEKLKEVHTLCKAIHKKSGVSLAGDDPKEGEA